MIIYNKKRFNNLVLMFLIFSIILVGLLYTKELIGEVSISYTYMLISFIVGSILIDQMDMSIIFNKIKNKDNDINAEISIRYMLSVSLIIIVISSIVFFGLYINDGYFFGIFSCIYLMTILMTLFYNLSFYLAKLK